MTGRIPRTFIDDLLARIDIVDIIDARVKLKKQGKNFGACCPFHNEKTPSFSVSQQKQFYHCFGCGASGNAISFLMEFDRLEFVETIEELAATLGIEIPYEKSFSNHKNTAIAKEKKQDLYGLLSQIAQFYQTQLKEEKGKVAVSYLKNRGLNGEIAQKFGIGYVADEWSQVLNHFGQDESSQQMLISAGMLIENENKRRYDRFRGRVMFPIRDKRGRVIAFGGRILTNDTPKYLNSPETPVFHKGRELYGLYEVLQAQREPQKILIVEGYMDVVALAQFGIHYAVASLGTATSSEHIQTLFRQTSTVICCYDGDRAGRDAAWRAMEQALPHLIDGRQLKFIFLPDGEDPDSMVRKDGKDVFEERLLNAQNLSEFIFATLMQQIDTSSYEGKTKLTTLAMPLIEKMPAGALREHLEHVLSERIGFRFSHELKNIIRSGAINPKQQQPAIKQTPMRTVITLLIQNPSFAEHVPELTNMGDIPLSGMPLFNQLLELCKHRPHITTGQLTEHWRNTDQHSLIAKLASWALPITDDNVLHVFLDALDKVLAQYVQHQVDKLQAKDRSIGLSAEERRELWQLLQSETV